MDGPVDTIRAEMEKGIALPKCQKCGCMHETLDKLALLLPEAKTEEAQMLRESIRAWDQQMQPVQYACLGCVYCYPAAAQNAFATTFPEAAETPALACDFRLGSGWPPVVGEYHIVDPSGHVAVSTLGSIALAQDLAAVKPSGLAIVGKTETENIGIDKIVKNMITNPGIQYLVLAGQETAGHQSGKTLLALAENGIDANGRVIGSPGKRPVLRNVTNEEVEAFRRQVQIVDLIGWEEPVDIRARIEALSPKTPEPCG
ncbi:MAG: hypothetical protein WCF84_07045 [Anaerolineae bacterium]